MRRGGTWLSRSIVLVASLFTAIGALPRPALAAGITISIGDVSVTEGNAGTVAAVFTVTLSAEPGGRPVKVDFATADQSATAPGDYTTTTGSLTYKGTTVTQTIAVSVKGDAVYEGNQTFAVNLSNPIRATIADPQAIGTILDDDPAPTLSVADATPVTEGNSGTTPATFTVTLAGSTEVTATVAWTTTDGTATAGQDYTAGSGTLTFPPGTITRTVTVSVLGDPLGEPNETFYVDLSNPANATIADGRGAGSITDDDPSALSIADASTTEGNSGSKTLSLAVTLSPARSTPVTVDYATADGTATAGSDYVATSGTLTFSPGDTSKNVPVTINGDVIGEADETFTVTLSNPGGASIGSGQATGTILDDEGPSSLTIADVSAPEGDSEGSMTFTVTMSPARDRDVTVHYATSDDVAVSSGVFPDYGAVSNTLTIPAGQTSAQFSVPIHGDVLGEPDETFFVDLSSPSGASIADGHAVGTIVDDDGPSSISIADASVAEGGPGTSPALSFMVSLSRPRGKAVTVDWTTVPGTATAGTDYSAASGTVTFAPGVQTATVDVTVTGDSTGEADETLLVDLSNPVEASIADGQATGTILNDDRFPSTITVSLSSKTSRRFTFSGAVAPVHAGSSVSLVLYKRVSSGRWKKISTHTALLGTGVTSSPYSVRFKNPGKGSYKVTASFAGDADHLPSSATRTFKA